jgi:hypothetical protein
VNKQDIDEYNKEVAREYIRREEERRKAEREKRTVYIVIKDERKKNKQR